VIYVMGAGHSGSSILGVSLGNCEDFFYAGEVEEWLAKSGAARWGGEERTRFWKQVSDEVEGADGLLGSEVNRCVERSSALLRIDRWPARARLRRRYGPLAEDLFGAISRAADAAHVVDTSHFPLRAKELQRLGGIELYVLFLVRDPQAVVASNVRNISSHEVAERRFHILAMNANLWLTYLLSVAVFLSHPRERRLFLRHEDFLADPEGVLRQILDKVGSNAAIPDLASLQIHAPLQGNRLLGSDEIAVERSTPPAARWSRITTMLDAWRPVFSRLRPSATATRHEHPSTTASR
jgi:Sulfotransferase family